MSIEVDLSSWKKCPLCGGDIRIGHNVYDTAWETDAWCEVECRKCGLNVEVRGYDQEREAVDAMDKLWNGKRHD